MKFNSFLKAFLFGFIVVFAISCDKDFNEIGADFVDSDHYQFATAKYPVVAYNQALGPIQTNNLPVNQLGYYNNPVFGTTKASFVTQLELGTVNPTFINTPSTITVDSVYLHVPYYSKYVSTDSDGNNTYSLLNNYGSGKIKLELFRSNYYLRNLEPNPVTGVLEQQAYYSDQASAIEGTITPADILNDPSAPASQTTDFEFSPSEIKFLKTDPVTHLPVVPNVVRERLLPGIYMDLDATKFKSAIIQAGSANLIDNNAFKNYFRGIYFKVSAHASNPNGGGLSLLNFAQGKIVIVYKDAKSSSDAALVRKTLTLNMKGYTVNLIENAANGTAANVNYNSAIAGANPTTGDSRLYLKGGPGSMAVIDLFDKKTNDNSPDLNTMRDEHWLINEANLTFFIDNNADRMGANDISLEPIRIFLYDFNNKKPLIDYYYDNTTYSDPKYNKLNHSGIISKVSETARGTRYKVRITNHIRNLIQYGGSQVSRDSTNVKLGVMITENINTVGNYKLRNPFSYYETNLVTGLPELKSAKQVPLMSIMSPLGTVLYGSTPDVPQSERLQLEIVYTKPDQN